MGFFSTPALLMTPCWSQHCGSNDKTAICGQFPVRVDPCGLGRSVVGVRWLLPYPAVGAVGVGQSRQNLPFLDVWAGPASGRTSGVPQRPPGITGEPLWT